MRKAIYALILLILILSSLSIVYMSYRSVSVKLEDVSISNIELKPNLKTLYDVLNGKSSKCITFSCKFNRFISSAENR